MDSINNADVMPRWVPDEEVRMEGWHPDWVKHVVMAQLRVESATPEGTFQSAVRVLDHYQELGVNALWLTPINDKGTSGNGYGNIGIHSVNPLLTGKDTYSESWVVVKEFVDEAHRRNIRIYLDAIVWGTVKESPLVAEHPDWYTGFLNVWGGWKWNWYNQGLRQWFSDQAVDIVMKTGIDGFRVDLEPFVTGHSYFKALRRRLLAMGRKISVMAECTSERDGAYDFDEQITNEDPERWNMHTMFTDRLNIVDAVKNGWGHGTIYTQDKGEGGLARFYCLCLSCHDNPKPCIGGNRVRAGYQAIFAPYVPLWFIGEDWINPLQPGCGMFNNVIRWDLLDVPENRAFYESMKKMMRIRRQYPDIFSFFPDNHRETNICKVESSCDLQAYARYAGNKGIVILANGTDVPLDSTAVLPLEEMGLPSGGRLNITELLQENDVRVDGRKIQVAIPAQDMAVLLVEVL
ncbi:MAG: alpha-amylase family glycosyl hydrolase [Saccharofermentanales bacterium]